MRLVPRIIIVRTVESLARIGNSAFEVSVWRRIHIFQFTFSLRRLILLARGFVRSRSRLKQKFQSQLDGAWAADLLDAGCALATGCFC
jgi:hypothetical protein